MRTAIFALALTALASMASADDQPPLTGKDVIQRLIDSNPQRFFPTAALQGNAHGEASLLCTIAPDGSLADCSVAKEIPTDQGFAEATRKIAGLIRIAPKAKDGSDVSGRKYLFAMKFGIGAR